ncbi:MAG TPA: GtrA family protein [Mycetocola sp.]|jgi:putative flippase GtrA|nr:GtrA family protein [Mycetocola sp.]
MTTGFLPDSSEPAKGPSFFAAFFGHSAVRYLLVGGSAFVLDIGLLALFHEVLNLPVWLATGFAFILSFVYTFTMQRAFSFGGTSPHGPALVRYSTLVAFNTLATMGIVTLLSATPLGWAGGKVLSTVFSTIWNYFAYRYWVFAAPRFSPDSVPDGASAPIENHDKD